jgi:hypothetical protein
MTALKTRNPQLRIEIYNQGVPFDRDDIEAKLALDLIASADMPQIALEALEAGLDVARGQPPTNAPTWVKHKPISWEYRFRHDPAADTGLGGVPILQMF